MRKINGLLALIALLVFLATPKTTLALTYRFFTESELTAGDLIRGETYSAVYYYGDDGMRYVFPNDKTYFTWYSNFDDVKLIRDRDLADIQIGGNVTYKPGVKMLKINSSPTVYAVGQGGSLRAIDSEEIAQTLYGSLWNQQVDDVPDGFFGNYELGSAIELSSQYDPQAEQADAFSISFDRSLSAYTLVEITDEGYNPSTVTIQDGTAIRFLNTSDEDRSATEWDRVWGSGTLNPGEHFTRRFQESGTWHYYSNYGDRNTFEGAIIVE